MKSRYTRFYQPFIIFIMQHDQLSIGTHVDQEEQCGKIQDRRTYDSRNECQHPARRVKKLQACLQGCLLLRNIMYAVLRLPGSQNGMAYEEGTVLFSSCNFLNFFDTRTQNVKVEVKAPIINQGLQIFYYKCFYQMLILL